MSCHYFRKKSTSYALELFMPLLRKKSYRFCFCFFSLFILSSYQQTKINGKIYTNGGRGEKGIKSSVNQKTPEASAVFSISYSPFVQATPQKSAFATNMGFRFSGASQAALVNHLKHTRYIRSEVVENVMSGVDRGKYSPHNPYEDSPQGIGHDATISAPHMHATALEYLKDNLKPNKRVLDVGCGSGYLTTCFAHMVGINRNEGITPNEGVVVGVDYIQALVNLSKRNIQKDDPELLQNPNFHLICGDGWKGVEQYGPYDAIHVGAAARTMPQELLKQLALGGIMIIPLGAMHGAQDMVEVKKDQNGNVEQKILFSVSYVPLVETDDQ